MNTQPTVQTDDRSLYNDKYSTYTDLHNHWLAQTHDVRPIPEGETEMNHFLKTNTRRAHGQLYYRLDYRKTFFFIPSKWNLVAKRFIDSVIYLSLLLFCDSSNFFDESNSLTICRAVLEDES